MNWYNKNDKELKDAISKIEKHIVNCSNFKIGKTGKDPKERFKAEDYKDEYDRIKEVQSSSHKNLIDNLEKALIERFKRDKRCDNVAAGGGDMDETEKYYVYVVMKQKTYQ